MAKLTPKRAMFVAQFLIHGNATLAAKEAGFAERNAAVAGSRLLKEPTIAGLVAARHEQRAQKLEVTAERVLEELAKLAYFDAGKLYDKDGNRIAVHELDDVTRAAVASVEDESFTSDEGVTRKQRVKMADKGQNLERLGRYLKLFDRSEFSASVQTGAGDTSITVKLVRPDAA